MSNIGRKPSTQKRLWALWLLPLTGIPAAGEPAPEVGNEGRYVVEAPRVAAAPVIDGAMAAGEWDAAAVVTGLTQLVPDEGAPATERTEVRIAYDAEHLYFGVRAWDSEADQLVANTLNRDGLLDYDDAIHIILDTFHDRKSGFLFATNPLGAQIDALVRQEGEEINLDWDGEWRCAASRDPEGFTVEIAIPFKTLRFAAAGEQVWGFNIRRSIARKQEEVFWKPMSKTYGFYARYKISQFGELSGLRDLGSGRRYQLKPYLAAGWEDQNTGRTGDEVLEAGLDVKFRLTSELVADLTVNTDFAEAEADVQQLNLTRFPLLFPEKRGFFLEGANLFYFGDRPEPYREADNLMFFSRRIGLTDHGGQAIPVLGGVKLAGEAGLYSIGALHVTTDETAYLDVLDERRIEPLTHYSVLRVKRRLFERSSIGLIGLNKDPDGAGANRVVGADWDFAFGKNLKTGGYLLRSSTPGLSGEDWAGAADVGWDSKHARMRFAYVEIGRHFNNEMGFVPRLGIRHLRADLNAILWPEKGPVRQAWFLFDIDYITDTEGAIESRLRTLQANGFFHNSAGYSFKTFDHLEVLTAPFEIHPGVVIPPGSYSFRNYFFGFQTDYSKTLGGAGRLLFGDFYDGELVQTFYGVLYRPIDGLSLAGYYERTEVELVAGEFVTGIFQGDLNYSFSPVISTKASYQWNSEKNSRLRLLFKWTYKPGADFFVVYEDLRDLTGPLDRFQRQVGVPGRSIMSKIVFAF